MPSRINYYWRILATGCCFACFGLGGFALSITILPLIRLMPASAERKAELSQYVVHHSFRLFIRLMCGCGVISVTIVNPEKLGNAGGHLIVANHPSLIDVILVISMLKKSACIVKQALWRNPFLRGVVSAAGYISNTESRAVIDESAAYIKDGGSLIVFPEGTRSVSGQPLKFQRGAANIALLAGKNIIPIIITCEPPSLRKNERWYNVPRASRMLFTVRVGETIDVAAFASETHSLAARRLTRFLENYYQQEIPKNEHFNTRDQNADYRVPGPRGYHP